MTVARLLSWLVIMLPSLCFAQGTRFGFEHYEQATYVASVPGCVTTDTGTERAVD